MGETIETFSQLKDYKSPTSPFSLPKAALCLLGFGNQGGKTSLKTVLKKLGCGLEITLLSAIPKGSGLGTSSVLAAAILGALHRAFGQRISQEDIIRQVLQMEQMLTTGGGWQDQIGGLTGGVKYLESQPGLKPSPIVYQLDSHLFTDEYCKNSMTLFYTGITRLAKNILGEVVGHFNSMSPAFLFTLERVKQLALDVRKEIALRDLQGVARCVQSSWEANKRIHPSTTNPQIDKMLSRLSPYYSGVKLLGAGGGGYAFFVSDSADSASKLRQRLQNEFEDEKARIVDFNLNTEGLKVSVS
jgi:galactokinase/mevalonate kinase-like predicted kinase